MMPAPITTTGPGDTAAREGGADAGRKSSPLLIIGAPSTIRPGVQQNPL
jgi:hypothetical protein